MDRAVAPRRFFVSFVTGFAGLGLILASLGIYGAISYPVTRQTQGIGIRVALGASRAQVQFGVIRRALRVALTGAVAGTAVSFVVAKGISSLLFGTRPTDPATFAAVVLPLCAVGLAAGCVPARRASRADPITAPGQS